MKLFLNKAHYPVHVLGHGCRIGIWTQGCRIQCPGCVSRDTWDADSSRGIEVDVLLGWCRTFEDSPIDGITISGGEPFDQPEALQRLVDGLVAWRTQRDLPLDILVFSGYPFATLTRRYSTVLDLLDAVIPEPFRQDLPYAGALRGSSNQPIMPLSALGRERYGSLKGLPPMRGGFQVSVENGRIFYIGVPDRGDMDRVSELARGAGVVQQGVSWRS